IARAISLWVRETGMIRVVEHVPETAEMLASTLRVALFVLGSWAGSAIAETLPLPLNLIGSATDEGEALLVGAEAREAYFSLADQFVTQKNQAYCGVASMVMVLN